MKRSILLVALTILLGAGCTARTAPVQAPAAPPVPAKQNSGYVGVEVRAGLQGDNSPIAGADVRIIAPELQAQTDAEGHSGFDLPLAADGSPRYYTLEVSKDGWKTVRYLWVHAYEGERRPNVFIYMVRGSGEIVTEMPCLDGRPAPCANRPPSLWDKIAELPGHLPEQPVARLGNIPVRELLPGPDGDEFLVQDSSMRLWYVGAGGQTALGESPGLCLVGAFGPDGYAYARKQTGGSGYEVVGVGREGSQRFAAAGYPGALHFEGATLAFVDAEGWKTVAPGAEPVLKARMDLGLRANQNAWCAWPGGVPTCLGGYWSHSTTGYDDLTVVRGGRDPVVAAPKGQHPVLGEGAFAPDGRMAAAVLGARSAGAASHGRVVAVFLDEAGSVAGTRDFDLVARSVGIDARGRLIVQAWPDNADGTRGSRIFAIDPGSGAAQTITEMGFRGTFAMTPGGNRLYLISAAGAVSAVSLEK